MSDKKTTSYYEMVDSIVSDLDKLYDRIGALRDCADNNEKDVYNHTRGALGPLANAWRQFRDALPTKRATMELGGWND